MKLFLPFLNGFVSLVDSFLNRTYVTHAIVSPNDDNGFVSLVDSFLNRTYVTHAIVSHNDDTSYVDNNVIELTTHHNVQFFYLSKLVATT